jgi:uncharacterized membrane protein (DUF106 family)
MKEKIVRGLAIAVVGIISTALIAYLKDEENRKQVKMLAKEYQVKFQKSARKTKKFVDKKVKALKA